MDLSPSPPTTATTNNPPRRLRKSSSSYSRRSTASLASYSSRSPSGLQHILTATPDTAISSVNIFHVEGDMKRERTMSMSSREGLEVIRDGHDEAMRKRACKEGAGLPDSEVKKGWFGSVRKPSKSNPPASFSPPKESNVEYGSPASSSAIQDAQPASSVDHEAFVPESAVDHQAENASISSSPVNVGNSGHDIDPRDQPQLPQSEQTQNIESTSPSKGSWFSRKQPPAINITNPTPTNSPSKPPVYPVHYAYSPPNPSPLSESTSPSSSPTITHLRSNTSKASKDWEKERGKRDGLGVPRSSGTAPKAIPRPRPPPFALSSTATASIDSHVPTLGTLTPPDSPTVPRIIVPAPTAPPSTTGWDTIRPRLSLPLLGRRKVPVEEFVTAVDPDSEEEQVSKVDSKALLKKVVKDNARAQEDARMASESSAVSPQTSSPIPQVESVSEAETLPVDPSAVSHSVSPSEDTTTVKEPRVTNEAVSTPSPSTEPGEPSEKVTSESNAPPTSSANSWFAFFLRPNADPNAPKTPELADEPPSEAQVEERVSTLVSTSDQAPRTNDDLLKPPDAETGSITPKGMKSVQSAPPNVEGAAASGVSLASVPASEPARGEVEKEQEKDAAQAKPGTDSESWFSWWPWGVTGPPGIATGDTRDAQQSGGEGGDTNAVTDGDKRELTAAEQIKEAALARDSPPTSKSGSQETDSKPLEANGEAKPAAEATSTSEPRRERPRADSRASQHSLLMATTGARASWVDFFTTNASLRSWGQKRIEDGSAVEADKEEEVMTVDFGGGENEGAAAETKSVAGSARSKPTSLKASQPPVSPTPSNNPTSKPGARSTSPAPSSGPKGVPRPSTPEPPKDKPQPPLTDSNKAKKDLSGTPAASSSASTRSTSPTPPSAKRPSLILPSFEDTFDAPPRSVLPTHLRQEKGKGRGLGLFRSGVSALSGYLLGVDINVEELERKQKVQNARARRARTFSQSTSQASEGESREEVKETKRRGSEDWQNGIWLDKDGDEIGVLLPRHLKVVNGIGNGNGSTKKGSKTKSKGKGKESRAEEAKREYLRGCRKIVIIGVHGWFPGTLMRSVIGAPTGTSEKFSTMMTTAVNNFIQQHGEPDSMDSYKITSIPLEGEGTIDTRVKKLYEGLFAKEEWVTALHEADVIFVATHSQGSIASTILLSRLLEEGHICTDPSSAPLGGGGSVAGLPVTVEAGITPDAGVGGSHMSGKRARKGQRIGLLAMCGIHLGPLGYLSGSLVGPYLQLFESAAATELFEFQDTENEISRRYVKALESVLDAGAKCVFVASLNDQVVPIYSGVFAAASHPSILRALYIDGEAYSSSDFLSNLLVLLLRLRNAGLDDNGLLAHLSEATAGSLNGIGHSTAYEDLQTYSLAVRYIFETTDMISPKSQSGSDGPTLRVDSFQAKTARNDYEIPWALREMIAYESGLFEDEWQQLSKAFNEWHPKTTILRDMKRKLQPIQRLRKSRL